MPDVRLAIKRLGESLLTASGAVGLARWSHRRRTLVLAYHNVIPSGEPPRGDLSLHLPQAVFAAQLDLLMATHTVIPLSRIDEVVEGDRPRVVITFDDAYRGALTAGLAELAKRALPATVFVAPGLCGTATWWDRLADERGGVVPPAARDAALREHQGRSERVLAALGRGAESLPAWARIADLDEVLATAVAPAITLGAHTWNHVNLAVLEPDALADELARPLAWLRTLGPRGLPWLAYPYGLTSLAVGVAAAAAGYAGAFRVDGGWLPAERVVRTNLPRLNVPAGLSLAGFGLRAAGLVA